MIAIKAKIYTHLTAGNDSTALPPCESDDPTFRPKQNVNEAATCNSSASCVHGSVTPNSCFLPSEIAVSYFNGRNKVNAMSHMKQFENLFALRRASKQSQ